MDNNNISIIFKLRAVFLMIFFQNITADLNPKTFQGAVKRDFPKRSRGKQGKNPDIDFLIDSMRSL